MLAVIFEVYPTDAGKNEYLNIAASLKKDLSTFERLFFKRMWRQSNSNSMV